MAMAAGRVGAGEKAWTYVGGRSRGRGVAAAPGRSHRKQRGRNSSTSCPIRHAGRISPSPAASGQRPDLSDRGPISLCASAGALCSVSPAVRSLVCWCIRCETGEPALLRPGRHLSVQGFPATEMPPCRREMRAMGGSSRPAAVTAARCSQYRKSGAQVPRAGGNRRRAASHLAVERRGRAAPSPVLYSQSPLYFDASLQSPNLQEPASILMARWQIGEMRPSMPSTSSPHHCAKQLNPHPCAIGYWEANSWPKPDSQTIKRVVCPT